MHSNNEGTAQPIVIGRPFAKGVSGNPGGRPVGSRNKLTADYMKAMAEDFAIHGKVAIECSRLEDPLGYIKVIASLMPKDVHISAQPLADLTEDELTDAIATIQRYLDAGSPAIGTVATIEGEATRLLPSIPEADGVPRGGEELPGAPADGGQSGGQDAGCGG